MFEVPILITIDDLEEGEMFKIANTGKVYMRILYPYSIDLTTGQMVMISDSIAIEPVYRYTVNREKE